MFGRLTRKTKSEAEGVSASDRLSGNLELWKQAVAVQQHFNEICWKIRGLALTAITVVLGATSFVAGGDARPLQVITLWGFHLRSAAAMLLVGTMLWLAFYFVDANWYHRLLKGAVKQASDLERELQRHLPAAGLTERISEQSPIRVFAWQLHSNGKLRLFYCGVAALLLALAAILQFGEVVSFAADEGAARSVKGG